MNPLVPYVVGGIVLLVILFRSFAFIGPTQIGLVNKRFGRRLPDDNVIARRGEAGYQAKLLLPGVRFKLWPLFGIRKYPWVQIPAGDIGVVVAQVGDPLPIGAKSAQYRPSFGAFEDLAAFLDNGGQKGVQRPVLPPGTLVPIHPVAFLVITRNGVYGVPVSRDLDQKTLSALSFGISPDALRVVTIKPHGDADMVGIVTTLEGEPLAEGQIAGRLGGFDDIRGLEAESASDTVVIEAILNTKNDQHNNYQDFQAFLDNGGRIGLQHDPLLYGAYLLNPFLVSVEMVPMLVVEQGEVAVIKSYVGLPTEDTSGAGFQFGSIVKPGHQGIWSEPLRTGKYAINPRCYAAEIVPTSILTLNWATATSQAHQLDSKLSQIEGKSREGFQFGIDLQVQIHVPDTLAPRVISMVGSMVALVDEVLQSAVGNYFRNALQKLPAIEFIETRDQVQSNAEAHIRDYLHHYQVETPGVYIQDVILPEQLVAVLQQREIARQEQATFEEQQRAQRTRVSLEAARGEADMQTKLAQSQVEIVIAKNEADAKEEQARGAAAFTVATGKADAVVIEAKGTAEAAAVRAVGVARAEGYSAQVDAIGREGTAMVAVVGEIGSGSVKIVPDVYVSGNGGGGGPIDALASVLTRRFLGNGGPGPSAGETAAPTEGGMASGAAGDAMPPEDGAATET